MRAAKVQASLRIRAASLNGWACAVKICHDGMLEDTNSLDAAQLTFCSTFCHIFYAISAFGLSSDISTEATVMQAQLLW